MATTRGRKTPPAATRQKPAEAAPAPAEAPAPAPAPAAPPARTVELPRVLTVKELGEFLGMPAVEVIKELMKNGVMAAINQSIDFETAAIVAHDLGFEPVEQARHEPQPEETAETVTRTRSLTPARSARHGCAGRDLTRRAWQYW